MKPLALIVAMDENQLIGVKNQLPWHLPGDFAWFRQCTRGSSVIMGSKTYASLPKRPLPGRRNIVVSRTPQPTQNQVLWVPSLAEALALNTGNTPFFIIGGATIYAQALPYVTQLYITRVHTTIKGGDCHFPPIDWQEWECVWQHYHPADLGHQYPFTFYRYERKVQ